MKFFIKNKSNFFLNFNYNHFSVNTLDNLYKFNNENDINTLEDVHPLFLLDYTKTHIKKRKINLRIKKGITKTEKKNSLKRDTNNTTLQQYINIMLVDGSKNTLFKNVNKAVESFFFILSDDDSEFANYKNFKALNFLSNNFVEYNNFDYLLNIFLPRYFSVFDIKTKKNNKKSRSIKKYSHEIVYISEQKRLKNVLKIINVYSENFKHYELWERLFWVFLKVILSQNTSNSYLLKRRSYVYKKAVKFFSNTNNK